MNLKKWADAKPGLSSVKLEEYFSNKDSEKNLKELNWDVI